MKVLLITDLVAKNDVLRAGEVVELDESKAKYLISVGRAEKVKPAKKELKETKKTKELKPNKDTK